MSGIRAEQKGDLHKAIEEFSIVIRLNPKFLFAYNRHANCWLRLSDVGQEEVNIEKALADESEVIWMSVPNKRYYLFRASLCERLGESEKAAADREKAKRK